MNVGGMPDWAGMGSKQKRRVHCNHLKRRMPPSEVGGATQLSCPTSLMPWNQRCSIPQHTFKHKHDAHLGALHRRSLLDAVGRRSAAGLGRHPEHEQTRLQAVRLVTACPVCCLHGKAKCYRCCNTSLGSVGNCWQRPRGTWLQSVAALLGCDDHDSISRTSLKEKLLDAQLSEDSKIAHLAHVLQPLRVQIEDSMAETLECLRPRGCDHVGLHQLDIAAL